MSSIFGKCQADQRPVENSELKKMEAALNHWNADVSNVWNVGKTGLGCLLLYNTPESLNEQLPLHDSPAQLSITADARLDNRDDIYLLLGLSTSGEKSIPDSSLILLLYKKYGADCVSRLVGDFAFAIWDEPQQLLFCARDQMGVKPFFYYRDSKFFAFATEKKGLLCLSDIDKTIDTAFFCNHLFKPCIQAADTTIYRHIRRLPPAHHLIYSRAGHNIRINRYWDLDADYELKLSGKGAYYEGLRFHFENAVRCRLRSAYQVGAELSGGLDSSAITGAACRFLAIKGRSVATFSNVDDEQSANLEVRWERERKYMEEVIRFNKIQDYTWITKDIWDNPLEEYEFDLKVNDGLEMASPLWLLPLMKAAMNKNVRALLSGFPGDEMVTYRGQFHFLNYLDHKQYAKYFTTSAGSFNKLKPFLSPGVEFVLHKIKNVFRLSGRDTGRMFEFYKIPGWLRFSQGDVVWQDIAYRERFKSYRHFQKYRLLKVPVAMRMEGENRFGLPFRTESRYPMADIRLTQFYLSMPNAMKNEGELSRCAYRAAVAPYLPEMIQKRDSKSGNIMPFRSTPAKLTKKTESLLKLLNNPDSTYIYTHKHLLQLSECKNIRPASIELISWFEKNFENLQK